MSDEEPVMTEEERADRLEAMIDRMSGMLVDKDAELFALRSERADMLALLREAHTRLFGLGDSNSEKLISEISTLLARLEKP